MGLRREIERTGMETEIWKWEMEALGRNGCLDKNVQGRGKKGEDRQVSTVEKVSELPVSAGKVGK